MGGGGRGSSTEFLVLANLWEYGVPDVGVCYTKKRALWKGFDHAGGIHNHIFSESKA